MSNFLRYLVVYGLTDVIIRLFGFLTLPIYTRYFSPGEYGVLSILGAAVSVVGLVCGAGVSSGFQREYYRPRASIRIFFSSGFIFVFILSILISISISVLAISARWYSLIADNYFQPLMFAAWVAPVSQLAAYTQEVLRLRELVWKFNLIAVLNQFVLVGTGLGLVVFFSWGVEAVFTGMILSSLLVAFLGVFIHRHLFMTKLSLRATHRLLKFGVPLALAGLSAPLFTLVDRSAVAFLINDEAVAFLAVGMSVAQILSFLNSSFGKAWSPFAWKIRYERDDHRVIYGKILLWIIITFGISASLISAVSWEIASVLVPEEYHSGWFVISPFLMYFVFSATVQVTASGISISGKTKEIMIAYWMAVVINALFDFVLIYFFGFSGAAYATLITEFFLTLYLAWRGQVLYPLVYEYKKIFFAVLICFLGVFSPNIIAYAGMLENIYLRVAAFVFSVFLYFFFGVVRVSEVKFVFDYVWDNRKVLKNSVRKSS